MRCFDNIPNGERPRLVLHIGGPKCGSTAIQRFLNTNNAVLEARGFLIPGPGIDPSKSTGGTHIQFFESIKPQRDKVAVITDKLKQALDHMVDNERHTLVISAENLCNHKYRWGRWNQHTPLNTGYADMFRCAPELFDFRVIMYVRRQDDWIASGWKQWGLKEYDDIREYIDECFIRETVDWTARLEPWREIFGEKAITVCNFDRTSMLNGDVAQDFALVADIDANDCVLSQVANPTIGDALARLANRANEKFDSRHDPKLYRIIGQLAGDSAFTGHNKAAFLSPIQRQEILQFYDSSNRELQKVYFEEKETDFFSSEIINSVPDDPFTQLQDEYALLMHAVYALADSHERIKEQLTALQKEIGKASAARE